MKTAPVWLSLISLLFIGGCASTNNGDPYIKTVDDKSNIVAPWSTRSGTTIGKGEAVSIFLDRAFFRYLPDTGNNSEVIFILEFDEGRGEAEKITKVVGPFRGIPDGTQSSFLNKLVYGPKPIEGSKLTMAVTVIELDSDENERSAAMLDFVASAAGTLGIANPVTATEIKAAKEIAKTLIAFNADDELFRFEMDFVSDNGIDADGMQLANGHWFAIKREVCPILRCYGQFYRKVGSAWYEMPAKALAVVMEVIAYLPISIVKLTVDSPDSSATTDIKWGEDTAPIFVAEERALYKKNSKDEMSLFRDKTWLSFSVAKGGDTSNWDELKKLSEIEQQLLDSVLKARNGTKATVANFAEKVVKLSHPAGEISLLSPVDNSVAAALNPNFTFSVEKPDKVLAAPAGTLLDSNDVVVTTPTFTITGPTANSRIVSVNFAGRLSAGDYTLVLTWKDKSHGSHDSRHKIIVK